ncbi:hypothetical protein MMC13_000775 [Lambiella insularis]|nr:hypothetical protein [Lambiella insularis]
MHAPYLLASILAGTALALPTAFDSRPDASSDLLERTAPEPLLMYLFDSFDCDGAYKEVDVTTYGKQVVADFKAWSSNRLLEHNETIYMDGKKNGTGAQHQILINATSGGEFSYGCYRELPYEMTALTLEPQPLSTEAAELLPRGKPRTPPNLPNPPKQPTPAPLRMSLWRNDDYFCEGDPFTTVDIVWGKQIRDSQLVFNAWKFSRVLTEAETMYTDGNFDGSGEAHVYLGPYNNAWRYGGPEYKRTSDTCWAQEPNDMYAFTLWPDNKNPHFLSSLPSTKQDLNSSSLAQRSQDIKISTKMFEPTILSAEGPADGHNPFQCARFGKEDCLKTCWVLSPDAIGLFEYATQPKPDEEELMQIVESVVKFYRELQDMLRCITESIDEGRPVPEAVFDEYAIKDRLGDEFGRVLDALQATGKFS